MTLQQFFFQLKKKNGEKTILLKEELVLAWLVQQKTTDTIEQVGFTHLLSIDDVLLVQQNYDLFLVNIGDDKMLSQVTDKVLEKLIEDEDFVAGR